MRRLALVLPALVAAAALAAAAGATPLASTREDFRLPGTQPLSLTHPISTPGSCAPCHSEYGQPEVEPLRAWRGSMMAQSGRDPLMWAALAVSNQDAPHSGETCLRCHLPKGWLEGRSAPEDGTAMTAADREGVQCGLCHRLVDPVAGAENPVEDAAILAALGAPVPALGGAMMVVDPNDRLRGPFDLIADLGGDPHLPGRSTLLSPFHSSSELCGTCHNLRNPLFTRNDATGEYELNTDDAPADPTTGFPEQSTYDEWAASEYASLGVYAPQFGGNKAVVSTCQDCHMPDVSGKDAALGLTRDDLPLHTFAGANTFVPRVLPFHPAFGPEVDAEALAAGIEHSTTMLRKAATVEADIAGGNLTVRVTNETGHKLPTGYPEGRRMWLHVRALDAKRNVVFESGRYVFSEARLVGYGAGPGDPEHDPHLRVWETEQGISPAVAALVGKPAGRSFHLSLNNVRLKDNRIPPRGFTNAAFEAFDGHPIGATYADGQHWDDVVYPVGPSAVRAEVTLYYQTTSREYVEFLRDENTTTAAGNLLFDLWDDHGQSAPVEMVRAFVESDDATVLRCRKSAARLQASYRKTHYKEWSRCFERRARGLSCDQTVRDARIAQAAAKLRDRLGGPRDASCAARNLTPETLGHPSVCPAPCSAIVLFGMADLASCALCTAETLNAAALDGAYGAEPPLLPTPVPAAALACQKSLDRAASLLADGWSQALTRCEQANASGKNEPPADCATAPGVAAAKARAAARIASCSTFAGLAGCGPAGDASQVAACLEAEVGAVVPAHAEVAYP
ncbi:MAG: hypothetical protein AB1689_01770 [Thermodesulfobacteriota bacterium]